MTHKHFWDEIFLPVKKQRDFLKFKQSGKVGKKVLSNKKAEGERDWQQHNRLLE